VQVLWRGRPLTYALGGDVPLEFRAEQTRREAAKQAARVAVAADDSTPAGEPATEPSTTAPQGGGKDQKPQKQE